MPVELYPKTLIFKEGNQIYDYTSRSEGGSIVSQKFKDCCEAVEPGGHQFVSVEVFNQDGTPCGDPYYFFRILTVRDAINPVLGGVRLGDGSPDIPEDNEEGYTIVRQGDDKLAVFKDRIEGVAAWHDPKFTVPHFFSDAFLQALENAGAGEGFWKMNYWHEL